MESVRSETAKPSGPRHHIVLVPGFVGFDALGQVHYYTGVSARFNEWKKPRSEPRSSLPPVELHYFDNLPTSSVKTRANRLLLFLAKLSARGDFRLAPGPGSTEEERKDDDKVFLVGHSTGGLDIRRLLSDLQDLETRRKPIKVDGDEVKVEPSQILRLIAGAVFLSVPQYGTNIADWVISHEAERKCLTWVLAKVAVKAAEEIPGSLMDTLTALVQGSVAQNGELEKAVWNTASAVLGIAGGGVDVGAGVIAGVAGAGGNAVNAAVDFGAGAAEMTVSAGGGIVTAVARAANPEVEDVVGAATGFGEWLVNAAAGFATKTAHATTSAVAGTVNYLADEVTNAIPHPPPADNVPRWDFRQVLLALQDSMRECSPSFATDPISRTNAREAASKLQFFLDNIQADFGAIDDLRNFSRLAQRPPDDDPLASPAHFSDTKRAAETRSWDDHGIKTLSYATKGRRPSPFKEQPFTGGTKTEDVWNPISLSGAYELRSRDGCDSSYLGAYFATAGGPFTVNVGTRRVKNLDGVGVSTELEQWDNDGIVNTASMLWPNGIDTRLVECDHGDIIGHYKLLPTAEYERYQQDPSEPEPGRRYDRYDFFVSGGGFGDVQLEKVWNEVFDFCG